MCADAPVASVRDGSASGSATPGRGVWTIIVGGGSGRRFGSLKQFAPVGEQGLRVIDYSLRTAVAQSDGVVVVVPEDAVDQERERVASSIESVGGGPADAATPQVVVVGGGASRSASVRNGLARVPDHVEVVCVHDAARPLATAELYRRVIDAVQAGADGVVPGVPVVDTLKVVDEDGQVMGTADRDRMVAVQTPQGFRATTLRAAHSQQGEATDDAGMLERLGRQVVVVDGETHNFKITTAHDLVRVEALLAQSPGLFGGEVAR